MLYDEPTIAAYVDHLSRFAEEHPGTSLVVSHLGMLDRQRGPPVFESSAHIFAGLSTQCFHVNFGNAHVLSTSLRRTRAARGTVVPGLWGPQRLLYGNNYPVMQDDAVYGQELDLLCSGKLGVPQVAVEQVLSTTAMDLWFDERTSERELSAP